MYSECNPPTALLHGLNLLWHSTVSSQPYGGTASLFFYIQTLALSVQDSYQRLRLEWINSAWRQIVSQVSHDCGNRNNRETWNNFGRGKSVLHNPAQLTTLCLWAHKDRRIVMLAQTKGLIILMLFWQRSATDAERGVKARQASAGTCSPEHPPSLSHRLSYCISLPLIKYFIVLLFQLFVVW